MKIMAMIFLGSMFFDQIMRYAMPVQNEGDGKAALQRATPIDEQQSVLNEAFYDQNNEESYGYISSEAVGAQGGIRITDETEGREIHVETTGKKKRRSASEMGVTEIKVLYCTS
jgi:hypothetical protein